VGRIKSKGGGGGGKEFKLRVLQNVELNGLHERSGSGY